VIQHLKLTPQRMSCIVLIVVLWFGLAHSAIAVEISSRPAFSIASNQSSTHFLSLVPAGTCQQLNLKSPALHLSIPSESGGTVIPYRDGMKTYGYSPGNSLEIQHDAAAMTQVWARNSCLDRVRLHVDVLAASS
jgi:hypothetical protein